MPDRLLPDTTLSLPTGASCSLKRAEDLLPRGARSLELDASTNPQFADCEALAG